MERILVTGATGFIGSHLVKKLVQQGISVYVIVRDRRKAEECLAEVLQKIVIYQREGSVYSLADFLQTEKIEGVIHLATHYITENSADDIEELIESNILFGTQILEAMKLAGVKKFINAGSSWQHYNHDTYNPVNLYAATKQAFEDLLHYYTQAEEIHAITLEIYDTYGAEDHRNKIINRWKRNIVEREVISLSLGEQKLDYILIEDVLEAILQAIKIVDDVFDKEKVYEKKYAVCSGHFYTLKEIAETFEQVYHTKLQIAWGTLPYRKREVFEPYSGTEILPGWEAKYSLKEGLQYMYQKEQKKKGEG